MPLFSLFGKGIVAPAIGIARGALELVVEQMRIRRMQSGAKVGDEPTAQLRAGEAAAEIDAAYTLLKRDCDEVHARAGAGGVGANPGMGRDAVGAPLSTRAADSDLLVLQRDAGAAIATALAQPARDTPAAAGGRALDAVGAGEALRLAPAGAGAVDAPVRRGPGAGGE